MAQETTIGKGQSYESPAELADHMKTDNDLDPLRDRADFQAFVASLTMPRPSEPAPLPRLVK